MTKKNKKTSLGKRLWHAITEPIPDDNDETETDEKIPLAYDLKTSGAPTEVDSAASEAAATQPVGEGDIQAPAEATSAASQAASAQSTHSQPTTRAEAKAARQAAAVAAVAKSAQSTAATSQQAEKRPESATSAVASEAATKPKLTKRQKTSQAAKPQSAATSQTSATARPTSVAQSASVTHQSDQPVISVSATERDLEDETPELPLSREELYGDQQPNGGSAAPQRAHDADNVDALSRVARHGEVQDDLESDETRDNPHLKKRTKGPVRPHQKQKPQRRNGKLTAIGVGLLVIAALGAMFMFKHAKTTEANAKAAAESAVTAIYTSSAQRDIRANVSDSELAQLQTAVDGMKQSDEKLQLQESHDYAAKMLKVRSRYQALYNSDKLIKASVTVADVTSAQASLTNSSLRTSKVYFTNRYTQKFTEISKIVKPVRKYDAEYQAFYTNKHKLKSTVSTLELDTVIKKLKPYRQKSALAKTDYEKLTAERKDLAKQEQSAATSAANVVSSSSSVQASSSSVESSSSSAVYSSATSSATTGTETDTSSAASSSTYDGGTSESSSNTYGTGSTTTGNGTGTGGTTASTTTTN